MVDFLHRSAKTPLAGSYLAADAECRLATNSEVILKSASQALVEIGAPTAAVEIDLRFWVDPQGSESPPWPKPYLRGLNHLIFGGYSCESSLVVDRRRRRAIGRFSPAMAADQAYWTSVIFPNLLTLLGPAAGVTGLHCACVVQDGYGILLGGPAGSGKSTLTLALARAGLSFLSDDWTFLSRRNGELRCWGLISKLKLLPEAVDFFPELKKFETHPSVNGEIAYDLDPELDLGISRERCCDPRWLILLERQPAEGFSLEKISAQEAAVRLEQDLLFDTEEFLSPQINAIGSLVKRGCRLLRYGGDPRRVAEKLLNFCETASENQPLRGTGHF